MVMELLVVRGLDLGGGEGVSNALDQRIAICN